MALRTANVNVRMEPAVKFQAAQVFADAGMSFSDAINAFCRETIKRNAIPFRFTARKSNPLDISKLSDAELRALLDKGDKSPARPAKVVFAEMEQALNR